MPNEASNSGQHLKGAQEKPKIITTMTNFSLIFAGVLLLNVLVTFRSSDYYKKWRGTNVEDKASVEDTAQKAEWLKLLKRYLVVYLLATLSDWLQGPYVYALYADYGFSQHDIAVLFVAGFGSSMVFGSFVGGMADWGGRRLFVLIFCAVYAASCVTKHFNNYSILMLGRLLGGVATSLLFSVFDAWLIRSHADAKLKSYLGRSFRWAAYGNSVIAIVAGLLANHAASSFTMNKVQGSFHVGGFLTPFDLALTALSVCAGYCYFTWDENYGEQPSRNDQLSDDPRSGNKFADGLRQAFWTTIRNQEVLLCGLITSLFEGSMYIFVFMWTPSLTSHSSQELPFGLIFSTFMVCCMAGSSVFSILMDRGLPGEVMAVGVFATASLAMALIASSSNSTIKFLGMNLFEITVGLYFPIMGTLKGIIVPESKRAAIYNLYRVPLNFIVLFSLLTDLTPTASFWLNAFMLAVACGLQTILLSVRRRDSPRSSSETSSSGGSGGADVAPGSAASTERERLLDDDSQRAADKDAAV